MKMKGNHKQFQKNLLTRGLLDVYSLYSEGHLFQVYWLKAVAATKAVVAIKHATLH